jgi:hypothetical protein
MKQWIAGTLAGAGMMVLAAGSGLAQAEDAATLHSKALSGTYLNLLQARKNMAAGLPVAGPRTMVRSVTTTSPTPLVSAAAGASYGTGGLPLWTYDVRSPRDGQFHKGTMVGTNPFTNPGSVSVAAHIVPVVLHIHSVATAIDPNTGLITTEPGDVWVNPAARDNVCLKAPNNVPANLLRQSPIFQPVDFSFGGTPIGKTQYIDAVQRANFINANPRVASSWHLNFAPVNIIEPLVLDVPASEGIAIDSLTFFGPPTCGTLFFVDISWFDQIVNDQVLPALAEEGVNASNLPIFLFYNTVLGGPINGLGDCCIGGYHSLAGFPTPTQTYSVADFDTTGLFGTAFADTAVISHELGEWANDPFTINLVPPWGDTGQVAGCQGNLEVGDPLTGTTLTPVPMPNGFSYDLQELVFFSWFIGGKSTGVNGWYSNNGTFATDAGPPCLLY